MHTRKKALSYLFSFFSLTSRSRKGGRQAHFSKNIATTSLVDTYAPVVQQEEDAPEAQDGGREGGGRHEGESKVQYTLGM